MKSMYSFSRAMFTAALIMSAAPLSHADNFIYGISTPGAQFAWTVDNIPAGTTYPNLNPTLILTAGATYRFAVNTTAFFHPVAIVTNTGGFPPVTMAYTGASPQAVFDQPITITIPETNYITPLYYICNVHGAALLGEIDIVPPPPPNTILSTALTTTNTVVMVSSGVDNTWVIVPEFSSNLLSKVWTPVDDYSNTYANGTNVTTFTRLDAICGPNVFLRLRQSPPTP
jgi:hypothetical protein